MAFNDTDPPVGWITIRSTKHCHLFLDSEPLTFTLLPEAGRSGAPPTPFGQGTGPMLATGYEVRDYSGSLVKTGNVSGSTLTITGLSLGWYRLYLRQAGSDATYGTLIGQTSFSIFQPDAHLSDPPVATHMATYNFDGAEWDAHHGAWYFSNASTNNAADHAVRGVTAIGPVRQSIGAAETPTADISNISADIVIQEAWYPAAGDSARPRPSFVQFPNGGVFSPSQLAGVTATVAALYPAVQYFEGPVNEPDLNNTADYVAYMHTFHDAVKAGNPNAKVMGPCPVGVNGGMIDRLDAFFAAGGGNYVDAISVHAYNCVLADVPLARRSFGRFKTMLAKYGLSGMELWQTEYGEPVANNGIIQPVLQAQIWSAHRLLLDQYGIPKERDCWFYETAHNFWGFPSYWKVGDYARGDWTVMPIVPLARTFAREVWGKTYTAALDFGPVENDFVVGNEYTDASTGAKTLALLSCGRTDGSVTLQLANAGALTVVSPFGTTSTVTSNIRKQVTIPIGQEPTYVRVPSSQTVTVVPTAYGTNVTSWSAISTAGNTASEREKITDGYLENWYYQGSENSHIEFRDDQTLPADVTVTLAAARWIDTAIIQCPLPRADSGSLLDYDFSYRDTGGTWHVLDTVVEPSKTVVAAGSWIEHRSNADSFYSNRRVFVHTFAPVQAAAVKITVRDCTRGWAPDAVAAAAQSFPGAHAIRLREIALYSRDSQKTRHLAVSL